MDEQQLSEILGCPLETAKEWIEPLKAAAARFDISTPKRMAAWLAQIGHESAGLTRLEENLNYSARRLVQVWPNRFSMPRSEAEEKLRYLPNGRRNALMYERNPEAIANSVYANRMGNGPEESGDGWRYRGRGPIQLTGKSNYRAFGRAMGGIPVEQAPDALLMPAGGAASAAWFWHSRELNELADRDKFDAITARINGGQHGRDDRIARWERARKILGVES